jgi:ABC-2 type transport system permease protein
VTSASRRVNLARAPRPLRVLAIARKELIQLRRDPVLPRLVVLLPVMMLILFGYALNTNVTNIPLAVHDASQDRVSRALVSAFDSNDRFAPTHYASLAEALEAVRRGRARGVLEVPDGAQEAARNGEAVPFTVKVDGSDPTVSAQVRAAAGAAGQDLAKRLLAGQALTTPGLSAPIDATFETLYNPDNRSAVYMVPGLIGLILTQITILLTSIAIVREREVGTMESLIATPVRAWEVVVGKVLPYLGIALLDAVIIIATGVLLFEVPVVGSVVLLTVATLLFVLGSLGIGIVVSTLARSQIQAVFGTMVYFLPSIFLSGLLFPLEGMTPFFNAISYAIPLRYFLRVARGVMLRGAGLTDLGIEVIALTVFAALMLAIASARFRKTL